MSLDHINVEKAITTSTEIRTLKVIRRVRVVRAEGEIGRLVLFLLALFSDYLQPRLTISQWMFG